MKNHKERVEKVIENERANVIITEIKNHICRKLEDYEGSHFVVTDELLSFIRNL